MPSKTMAMQHPNTPSSTRKIDEGPDNYLVFRIFVLGRLEGVNYSFRNLYALLNAGCA